MSSRQFWKHQHTSWQYAKGRTHPALFLEMRLGKTLVVIRTIKTRKSSHILIVGPSSVLKSWLDELKAENESRVFVLDGARKKRLEKLRDLPFWWPDAWECPPHGFRVWCLINKEGFLALPEIADVTWDEVILDESTFIKNPKAQVSRFFCRNFRSVPHRWILTGMPNPESFLDFFQQMKFLDGRFLGCDNFWKFRSTFFLPTGYGGYDWKASEQSKKKIINAVSRRAKILRREHVGMDQRRVYEERSLILPQKVRKVYDETERTFILRSLDGEHVKDTKYAVAMLTMLRHLCNGYLDGKIVWDGKVEEIMSLLTTELSGEPALIWFAFNNPIQAVQLALERTGVSFETITGEVPLWERNRLVQEFQDGRFRIFLLQVSCASYGMNLSRTANAIYYDSPTSTLLRRQSEDRILSLSGSGPLLFLDLVVRDTVSEDIHDLIHRKADRSVSTLDIVRTMQERRLG